jgi:NAD(P)-dependent dehydrogenase (short-subunit alcohol dehydrogenase family)
MARFASDPDYIKNLEARTPLGGIGSPELVAQAAINMIRSDWLTGQVVMVDGGSSLMTARSTWLNARSAAPT